MDHDSIFEDYNPLSSESNENCSISNMMSQECDIDLDISNIEGDNNRRPITIQLLSVEPVINNENVCHGEKRQKRNKADLNKTPLPIFECIYCSNEVLSFGHLSSVFISYKYVFCASIENMTMMQRLISSPLIIEEKDLMKKMIVDHSEYLRQCYSISQIKEYFGGEDYSKGVALVERGKYDLNVRRKLKKTVNGVKNRKTFEKTVQYQKLNQAMFIRKNSKGVNEKKKMIDNVLSLRASYYKNINDIKTNKKQVPVKNIKNYNEKRELEIKEKHVEQKDNKADFFNFLKFDMKRKIKYNDIEWESKYFSIWDPSFDDNYNNNDTNKSNEITNTKNNLSLSINKTPVSFYQNSSEKVDSNPIKSNQITIGKNKLFLNSDLNNHSHSQSHCYSNSNNNSQTTHNDIFTSQHHPNPHSNFLQKDPILSDSPIFKSCSSIQSKLQEFLNDNTSNQYNSKSSKMLSTQCESKVSANSPMSINNININQNFTKHFPSPSLTSNHIHQAHAFHYQKINSHCINLINPSEKYVKESKIARNSINYNNRNSHNDSRNIETSFMKKKKDIIELIHQDISTRRSCCIFPAALNTPKRLTKLTRTKINMKSILFSSNKFSRQINK